MQRDYAHSLGKVKKLIHHRFKQKITIMKKQNTIKCAGKQQLFLLGLGLLASSAVAVPTFAKNNSIRSLSNTTITQAQPFNHTASQEAETANTPNAKKNYRSNYWFVGVEAMSPLTFGTLYSLTNQGDLHLGLGAQLSGGYQFSSVFGLQATFGAGKSSAFANDFQRNFYLGQHDAYTYYPYTMIDGTVYHFPVTNKEGKTLIGEQGNNPQQVQLAATPFPQIKSNISFWQASVNADLNLTRLFFASTYEEKPVELWLRPGAYLSSYTAKVVHRETGKVVAPKVNNTLTIGLGGDVAVRFNLSPRWAIDVNNRFIWQHDRSIDGVQSIRRAYDSYVWQPAVGVVYKFRKAAPEIAYVPAPAPVQPQKPVVNPLTPELAAKLLTSLPEHITIPEAKPRNYSASIALTYPLNKTYIVRNLHNNAAELARVDNELRTITANKDYRVRNIRVEGFASPEGPLDNNFRLSTGRAQSIIDYLVQRNPRLDRSQFQLGRVTENWDGLRDTLTKNPNLPSANEVLALLKRQPDTEIVKQEIKRIAGYPELLKNVYPYLRKSSYTVQFDVRAYALPEAKEKMKTHPENVGAEEMYAVALDYGFTTAEGKAALATLQQVHPDAPLAKLCRAHQMLENKQNEEALRLLQSFKLNDGYYYNLLGVALARNGQWEAARQYFQISDAPAAMQNLQSITVK